MSSRHADGQSLSSLQTANEERIEVADLAIEGVRAVDESQLRAALQTRANSWWPWGQKRYFDADVFEADVKRVEEFYKERGYPNVRVTDTQVERRDGEATIRIVVDEGTPLRVASLEFTGFDVIGSERVRTIRELVPLEPGDPLSTVVLRQTAQMAADVLGEAGYPYARIEIRQTASDSDRVAVEFHALPGEPGYFGAIEIVGNSSVADEVIRRQVAYLPGERFRVSALRDSERRLSRLGLFQSVTIDAIVPEPPTPEVTTRITVKEGDLNQFTYSFGYGSEEQLYGEGQWRLLNFLGGGRSTTVRGRWSSIDRGGDGTFYQPNLFTPRLSLQLSAGAWHIDESVYTVKSVGGSAGLGYLLGRFNRVSTTYLHQSERNSIREEAVADGSDIDLFNGVQDGILAALRFDVARDTTLDVESPRTGYRALARFEKAGGWLPGDFAYRNYFTDNSYYRAVGRATLAGRLQVGSIDAENVSELPFSRRYFLGGADTLRGWGRYEVSPLTPSGVPVGGRSVFLVNSEVRVPISRRIGWVAFVDAGNVWANTWELHLNDLRSNVGTGARVATPFGLIRVDAGYQLTPIEDLVVDGQPQDRRWRIHLSLGQVF